MTIGRDGAPADDRYLYSFNDDAMSYAIDEAKRRELGMHFAIFEPGWLPVPNAGTFARSASRC